MLHEQRLLNPDLSNSALLQLCPKADEWVERSRELVLQFEYATDEEHSEIVEEIQKLHAEIGHFTLQPITITLADFPTYIELYSHVLYALQHLTLFLTFRDLPR